MVNDWDSSHKLSYDDVAKAILSYLGLSDEPLDEEVKDFLDCLISDRGQIGTVDGDEKRLVLADEKGVAGDTVIEQDEERKYSERFDRKFYCPDCLERYNEFLELDNTAHDPPGSFFQPVYRCA